MFILVLTLNLTATNKIIISTAKSANNAYLTSPKPEIVVNTVVITGEVAMIIVLSKPTLEAKILRLIVVTNYCCILSEAVLTTKANKK